MRFRLLHLTIAIASLIALSPASADAACPASSSYSNLIASTPGLVSYWRLGETSGASACDTAAGRTGSLSGGYALGQAGAIAGDADTAIRFNAGGAAFVPHAPELNLNGAFTIEAWVEPQAIGTVGYPGIFRKGNSSLTGAGGGWLIWYWPDNRQVQFKREGQSWSSSSWTLGLPGAWSHVVVTYDGVVANTLRYYVDGVRVGSEFGPPAGFAPLASTDDLWVGRGDDTNSDHTVDEAAVYATALSDATIQQHHQVGLGAVGAPTAPPSPAAAAGDGKVMLSWGAASDTDLNGYRVYRRNADGSWPSAALASLPDTTRTYADTGVTNGTAYSYRITATDAAGHEGPPSAIVTATPAGCGASASYAALVTSSPSLVGYWRLGETSGPACDIAGGSAGSYSSGVVRGQPGAIVGDPDQAARFSGGAQVSVPSTPALALNGAFTIEAWVKPESLPASGWPGIVRKGSSQLSGAGGGWLIWYDRTTRDLNFKREGASAGATGWQLASPGAWTHVAVSYDGTQPNTLRFYVNGGEVGTDTGPPGGFPALSSTDPLQIGRGDDDTASETVDDVAIYSSALSGGTLAQHYSAATGSSGAPTPPNGLSADAAAGSVSLRWNAATDTDLAGYRVYRRNADGSWPAAPLATLGVTALSYTDTAVTDGTPYTYRVTAFDAAGHESVPSAQATGTPGAPLPPGFQEATLVGGLTIPTAVTWAPDGRMFITQKNGRVRVASAGGTLQSAPLIDISDHVNNAGDRGLLGLAVDSAFATNHWLYLLYSYELNPGNPDGGGPMVSRLTRVTVNPDNTLVNPTAPETVILGSQVSGPCPVAQNTVDCIPSDGISHSIGTIRADTDGTLWVGSGDAADYGGVDPLAYRTYDEQSFAGKLLHIDRNGRGLPGHPFCATDPNLDHVCAKLYAKGFRNPFRFSLRDNGAGPTLGDVGWNTMEELDLPAAGGNYGWPCYEAGLHTAGYSDDAPCAAEYAKEGTPSADIGPIHSYPHIGPPPGGAIIGGPVYKGSEYPASYRDSIFFGDYVHGTVKRAEVNAQGVVTGVQAFANQWGGVDLTTTPGGGIAWVDLGGFQGGAGAVKTWVYSPTNSAPTARASASPSTGAAPLDVSFTGSSSTDPDGDTLSYDWDFGDGSVHSSAADPAHRYAADGTYTARLTVTDSLAHSASATAVVTVSSNRTPTATITAPPDGSSYRDGVAVTLQGGATDPEDGPLGDPSLSWHVILHHGSHTHDGGTFTGRQASFTPFADHDADSSYEVTLTATDSGGRTDTRTISLLPQTISLTLASNPAGAPLSYGGRAVTAPTTLTTAVGFATTISAADSFTSGSTTYRFTGWSDGGARLHNLTVPAADTTLTATYTPDATGDGVSSVAASGGSSDATYFPSNHRLVVTAGGRLLAVHGRSAGGVQLAWRDGAGPWRTTTTGATTGGVLLPAAGSWPASIAVGRDSGGAERAWVVWGAETAGAGKTVQLRRLSSLDAAGGPSVGPVVTVDAPAGGATRPDIAIEPLGGGAGRAALTWVRRTSTRTDNLLTAWLSSLNTDTPTIASTSTRQSGTTPAFGSLIPGSAGVRLAGRGSSGTLRLYSHAASAGLTTWTTSATGGAISTASAPAGIALSSGDTITAVESDTSVHVVKVQRWPGGAGTPSVALSLTGYQQPSLATDGSRAWLVLLRSSDVAVVSREMSPAGSWAGADQVEIAAAAGGPFAWPSVARDVNGGRLRLLARGATATAGGYTVLLAQRAVG